MKKVLSVLAIVVALLVGAGITFYLVTDADPYISMYADNCARCHGDNMEGSTTMGPPLVDRDLKYGDSMAALTQIIGNGSPTLGMPAWNKTLTEVDIKGLAIYISERRAGRAFTKFNMDAAVVIPPERISSERYGFHVDLVAEGLHELPFSIAPMPDGRILVTEKAAGLRIISANGEVSDKVPGLPEAYDDGFDIYGVSAGKGWLLDIALHPDYEENGWIYLHHTQRCTDCDDILDTSMNRIVRGRIKDAKWIDEEVIWEADPSFYTMTPDVGAGGRLAFDDKGYVYFSIGIKAMSNYEGIQNLSTPYGKIHRIHDDGRIPQDNPFIATEGAYPSTWTYGHRSPQGLEYHAGRGELWGTEMGPRGGDELNLLLPGRNYGWPLTSLGIDYDGTPVEYGKELGIEFDLADMEQPKVDFTPAPAINSFIFYQGDKFPAWRDNILVGSLMAQELYRIELDGDREVHRETLLSGIARIRDIELGYDGHIYLLLESELGSKVARLSPVQ